MSEKRDEGGITRSGLKFYARCPHIIIAMRVISQRKPKCGIIVDTLRGSYLVREGKKVRRTGESAK